MTTLYVSMDGSDTNSGSESSPFLTVAKAIKSATEDETTIQIMNGEYEVYTLNSLSASGKKIIIKGKNEKTTLIVKYCEVCGTYAGNVDFYNMIIKPSNNFSGDTRAVVYTNCSSYVNFYNCVFSGSDNNAYPTDSFFYVNNSGNPYTNKNLYNCSFNNVNIICRSGTIKIYNCCTNMANLNDPNYIIATDCITGVEYDANYNIIEASNNSLYGVYSGDNAWLRACLIKYNGNIYSIKKEYYNSTTKMYTPITDLNNTNFRETYGFNVCELFNENVIDGEIFKPIDKFDNFTILSLEQYNYQITGLMKNTGMVVNLESISLKQFFKLYKLTPTINISSNCSIKMAISFDKGVTWKTHETTNGWIDLTSTNIPLGKDYENLTDPEKINWNNSKADILANGIDVNDLINIDMSTLDEKTMMLAIAFSVTSASDTCSIQDISVLYDEVMIYTRVDDKCTVQFRGDTVSITPTFTTDKMLFAMVTNI